MIEFENDPVWTPLNPSDGDPWWEVRYRTALTEARVEIADGPAGDHHTVVARWDAEARQWVVVPPARVEVTGVPSRYRVIDKDGSGWGVYPTAEEAWDAARYRNLNNFPQAPFSVEACIPVPRNEANQ